MQMHIQILLHFEYLIFVYFCAPSIKKFINSSFTEQYIFYYLHFELSFDSFVSVFDFGIVFRISKMFRCFVVVVFNEFMFNDYYVNKSSFFFSYRK